MPSPTARELQTLYMWGQGSPVQIDMQDYFSSYGRYGISAAAAAMTDFNTFPLGVERTYEVRLNNYITDIYAGDYFDRALGYGTTSFTLTGQYVMVDGERRFIGNETPWNDNYDFAPGNQGGLLEWTRWGTGLLLDPFGRGTTVPTQFTGTPLSVDWNAEDVANLTQTYIEATQEGRLVFQTGTWSQQALGFGQLALENAGKFLWQFPEALDTAVVAGAGLYAGGARLLYAGGVLGSTFLLSGDARADESAAGAGLMGVEGWLLPSQTGAGVWNNSPITLGASFDAVPSGVPGVSLNYGSSYGTLAGEAYDPFTVFESASQIAGIGFSLTADIGSGGFASAATYAFTPGQTSNSIFDDSWLTDYSPTYNYSGNGYADSDWSGSDYSASDYSGYYYSSDDFGSLSFDDDFRYDSYGFPVVLDLAGNGLNITPQSSSNVFYDMAGDGYKHRTAWAGTGNGVLVLDLAGTGQITERNQVIFTDWDPTATSDMQALANVFDTNHNGKLDAGDAQFSAFKILVTNPDGTTSLQSLAAAGVRHALSSGRTTHSTGKRRFEKRPERSILARVLHPDSRNENQIARHNAGHLPTRPRPHTRTP